MKAAFRDAGGAEAELPKAWNAMRSALVPVVMFAALLAIYLGNGDYLFNNDVTPDLYLPIHLLKGGGLSFTPEEFPFMFYWHLQSENGPEDVSVQRWSAGFLDELRKGALALKGPKYYLVPSARQGVYVSYFGPGAGLSALPFFAGLRLFAPRVETDPVLLWTAGKWVAACFAAGSAVFVYLAALVLSGRVRYAALVGIAYALGTCVWSSCSQDFTQQSPNVFFLALGCCFLVLSPRGRRYAALCGAACAWAVCCRPTSVLVAVAIAGHFCLADRRKLPAFLLAGLPFALAFGAYNWHYFGSLATLGQTVGGTTISLMKTDSPDLWQTHLHVGLAGVLESPSRGLFVYSPFLVFALWGAVRVWRDKTLALYRPLTIAAIAIILAGAKHFDWWSGWSFGYRHIIDVTVFLTLMLVPILDTLARRKVLLAVFCLLLCWSFAVQALGVFVYDMAGWNNRVATVVRTKTREPFISLDEKEIILSTLPGAEILGEVNLDIDAPENRNRLWSISDSQIVYYVTHLSASRSRRQQDFDQWRRSPEQ